MSDAHDMLVEAAGQWLRKKCSVVLTELCTTGEIPDAIGWHGTSSILVECKASVGDFQADAQKHFRRYPEMGVGQLRYFLTLPSLISASSMPAKWGLLELTGSKIRTVQQAMPFDETHLRNELGMLLSALRRIGQAAPKGVSIRCYTIPTKSRATISVEEYHAEPQTP